MNMVTLNDNKKNSEPFYKSIYEKVLIRLKQGESTDTIYDDRGANLLKTLNRIDKSHYENALEIGCGLGQASISLSTKCNTFVAADISPDALRVLTLIAKKLKIRNINPVLVDATHLPFRENSFDLVVCNGVLEWVPVNHDKTVSPTKFQIFAIKEISRSLNNTGLFWLGIENRYSYGYLLGTIDHHSGLRFVTFLPRAIAKYYSKLLKKQPYRNYLYNYWELKKIIQTSGLVIKRSLTAFPNYPNPRSVVDLSSNTELAKTALRYQGGQKRFYPSVIKVFSSLRLTKLFIPNFVILSAKSSDSKLITSTVKVDSNYQ